MIFSKVIRTILPGVVIYVCEKAPLPLTNTSAKHCLPNSTVANHNNRISFTFPFHHLQYYLYNIQSYVHNLSLNVKHSTPKIKVRNLYYIFEESSPHQHSSLFKYPILIFYLKTKFTPNVKRNLLRFSNSYFNSHQKNAPAR